MYILYLVCEFTTSEVITHVSLCGSEDNLCEILYKIFGCYRRMLF